LQTLIENLACFLAHNSCVALNNIGKQTINIGSNVGNYTVFALSGHLLPCTGFKWTGASYPSRATTVSQ
jgi:hypothetical protein